MDKIDDINRNAAAAIAATLPVPRDGVSAMAAAAGRAAAGEKTGRKPTGEESPELRKAIKASQSGYRAFWPALSRMPALSHWPNRPEPFDPTRSEVYAYILCQCRQQLGFNPGAPVVLSSLEEEDIRLLGRIHSSARSSGVISFDPETQLWRGMAPPWQRYRKPSEIDAERRRYRREGRARAARICVCEKCGEWFEDGNAFRAHVAEKRLAELGYWPETEDSLHA